MPGGGGVVLARSTGTACSLRVGPLHGRALEHTLHFKRLCCNTTHTHPDYNHPTPPKYIKLKQNSTEKQLRTGVVDTTPQKREGRGNVDQDSQRISGVKMIVKLERIESKIESKTDSLVLSAPLPPPISFC